MRKEILLKMSHNMELLFLYCFWKNQKVRPVEQQIKLECPYFIYQQILMASS